MSDLVHKSTSTTVELSGLLSLLISSILLTYLAKELLNTDDLFDKILIENFSTNQLDEIARIKKDIGGIGYILIPIFLLLKICVTALVIWIGCFLSDKKVNYKSLFNLVVKAEFVFLLAVIFKTIWFYFFNTEYSLEDIQYFYPLSVLNTIGYKGLDPWYIYPLQVLNLFEFIYWMLLTYLLAKELNVKSEKAFNIVASSYGSALLIWVVAIMFLTINFS